MGNIKTVIGESGLFLGTAMVFQQITQQLRDAGQWVKYLDDSFTDMKMTMSMSTDEFNKMSGAIDTMSKDLGVNAQEVHDIARIYANATTTTDAILERIKPEAQLQNISEMNGLELTKTVQTIGNAFDMVKEDESNVGEVTQHIGDVFANVSKNMKYDYKSGIVELTNAIKEAGSVASESGMSMEQYTAYMGAMIERTGKSGLIGSL